MSNKGREIGGPICDPIRHMMRSNHYNGVRFRCDDEKRAEQTRTTALILRRRNNYKYKTMRRGDDLLVYTGEYDPDREHYINIAHKDGEWKEI